MLQLPKYPRTKHFVNSKESNYLGSVDFFRFILQVKPFEAVVTPEEKIDGSCVSIAFDNGRPVIHHRNTIVTSREFDLLKSWVAEFEVELYEILGERFIMYGEWLYYCHTIYYNRLDSYFIEYDVYDKTKEQFLSTRARLDMFGDAPVEHVCSPVPFDQYSEYAVADNVEVEDSADYVISTGDKEGVYLKVETIDYVIDRYKFIRKDFIDAVLKSRHWSKRNKPILNKLSTTPRGMAPHSVVLLQQE